MKTSSFAFLFLAVLTVSGARASESGEILLNAASVRAEGQAVTLVRTAESPAKIRLEMTVPVAFACVESVTEERVGRHKSCGTEVVYREVEYCLGNESIFDSNPRRVCSELEKRTRIVSRTVNRSCTYSAERCVRRGDVPTRFEERKVKLDFRKAVRLTGAQRETYVLKAQGSHGLELEAVDTQAAYTVDPRRGIFGGLRFVVKR